MYFGRIWNCTGKKLPHLEMILQSEIIDVDLILLIVKCPFNPLTRCIGVVCPSKV